MSHEVETMFYAGEVPWHGLGTRVDECLTSAEAITKAGLDWEVKLGPLYGPKPSTGGGGQIIKDRKAIYRTDNYRVLGIGTKQYQPYVNRECFDWVDSLVADGVMRYETAGSLFDGRQVWMLAKVEDGFTVNGDAHQKYVLLTTRHDTYGSVRAKPTNVRAVCKNTVMAAMRQGETTVRVVHRPSMAQKMAAARTAIEVVNEASLRLKTYMELAQKHKLTADTYSGLEEALLGPLDDSTGKQRRDAIATFRAIYDAERALHGATVYSFLNTVTGYADHRRRYLGNAVKQAESRMWHVTEGDGFLMKREAVKLVNALDPDLAKVTI